METPNFSVPSTSNLFSLHFSCCQNKYGIAQKGLLIRQAHTHFISKVIATSLHLWPIDQLLCPHICLFFLKSSVMCLKNENTAILHTFNLRSLLTVNVQFVKYKRFSLLKSQSLLLKYSFPPFSQVNSNTVSGPYTC